MPHGASAARGVDGFEHLFFAHRTSACHGYVSRVPRGDSVPNAAGAFEQPFMLVP